ncbi:hypothetical protein [Amycolatopsis speibonae]|uniref:Uncharacterized protein n=1 Tax=Amycolatopsis speibonae TaxID=1450224 RepID=A0ABV7PDK0_9PSEU
MNALQARLAFEDRVEDMGVLDADDRVTCHVHGRWIHQCVASPIHVNPVTRHRWCRDCERALTVVIDELAGVVTMNCSRCGGGVSGATAHLLTACRASLRASGRDARSTAEAA